VSFLSWLGLAERFAPITGHPADRHGPDAGIDAEGWLYGLAIERAPSVRHSALSVPEPLAIVWHYTATDAGTAKSLAKRIRTYKRGTDRAASWHVLVGADGVIRQSVSFLRGSWHCARGTIDGHRVNACSVGVELEGRGQSFPDVQVNAAIRLVRALLRSYSISRENAALGHSEFDPDRRSDPGPVWRKHLPDVIAEAVR
jgi:N-acetyl-anhydromuramyl-L-alanine amidase AmpD